MKKIIAVVVMLALSLTICISGYAEESAPADKVGYLVSWGIPEKLIGNAPTKQIDDMYASFFGKSIEYLGTETNTMSSIQDMSSAEFYGTIPSSDMTFSVSRFAVRNDKYATKNDPIDYIYVYISYEWSSGHPLVRWKDGITVNWDPNVFTYKSGSFSGSDVKRLMGNVVKSVDYNEAAELTQGGIGYHTDLNTTFAGTAQTAVTCSGAASIILLPKKSPMYIGNVGDFSKSTTINANYLHNKNPFGFSVGFSILGFQVIANVGGISDSVAGSVSISYK